MVLMTMLSETVTVQAVCPFTVHTMLVGLRRVTIEGKVVIKNPFYKLYYVKLYKIVNLPMPYTLEFSIVKERVYAYRLAS